MNATMASGLPVYTIARGRYAPQNRVVDQLEQTVSVVSGRPDQRSFVQQIEREMRIRCYQPNTLSDYKSVLRSLFAWFGRQPHQLTREDVREFLLYLVDAGASASWVSVHLSAIRTIFDKMCLRHVTLGLVTPRRPKTLPIVLSKKEVQRLLESTPTLRDKLLLGLMYATGLRVSEVARLRYQDFDFDRRQIRVCQGKGRKDRYVILPNTFDALLKEMSRKAASSGFLFPSAHNRPRNSASSQRHISPRTIQRVMKRSLAIASIGKPATPHSLRHSFATHSFENGCDIRSIQKLLGHANLETTTIYVKVAQPRDPLAVQSPLDAILAESNSENTIAAPKPEPSVGKLQLHLKPAANTDKGRRECQLTIGIAVNGRRVYLTGIVAQEVRPGWITLQVPPLEQWEEQLRELSRVQRQRIESPRFFEMLQRETPRRFTQAFPQ